MKVQKITGKHTHKKKRKQERKYIIRKGRRIERNSKFYVFFYVAFTPITNVAFTPCVLM